MALLSPFQRVPGTFKYGDLTYEWRTLLNTPCYGFNGPNACYSSTCKHDGSVSTPIQQQEHRSATKRKLALSKLSMKFNWQSVSDNNSESDSGGSISNYVGGGDERILDTGNSAIKSLLTEQMNVYVSSNMYSGPSKGNR